MLNLDIWIVILFILFLPVALYCSENEGFKDKLSQLNKKKSSNIEERLNSYNMKIIDPEEYDIVLDIKYATKDNFTGIDLYKKNTLILNKITLSGLKKSIAFAKILGYRIKIFDGFRPLEVQKIMYDLCPSDKKNYVSNPNTANQGLNNHTRGLAIDLTLIHDSSGEEVDMGTNYDHFSHLAHPDHSENLTLEQIKNRTILSGIMSIGGFIVHPREWWHFDFSDQINTAKQHPILSDAKLKTGIMINE